MGQLRTVLYSTLTEDGYKGVQGKTILTTFQDPDDHKIRVHKARYGIPEEEDVLPVTDENDIPDVYKRDEVGTDIFIFGFEKDDDWMHQIAMSVIEFFFYAIYKRTLEVDIEDGEKKIHIGADNLDQMIQFYDEYCKKNGYEEDENFQYTAPLYWKAITDPSKEDEGHYHIVEDFKYRGKSMGQFELYLLINPEVSERRVLEMREAGMKIREDTKFRIQPSFIGVFIATGAGAASLAPKDNISSFLRKCENPAHDAWAAANYSDDKRDKEKAKSIINGIHKKILDIINDKIPKNDEQVIKAYGVNELLMSQDQGDAEDEKEEAFLNANPKPIELLDSKIPAAKKRDLSQKSNGRGKKTRHKHKDEDDTKKKRKRDNKKGNKKKGVVPVDLKSIKMPFDDNSGSYRVVFSADSDVSKLYLALESTGDDGTSESADITEAIFNGEQLELKEDCVIIPNVKTGMKYIVGIKLRGSRRERLVAKAYGEL